MAYTDDWESLMNGVFGPGGRFKAAPADPAADSEPKAKTAGPLPDLNAALLAQQKKLDEMHLGRGYYHGWKGWSQ